MLELHSEYRNTPKARHFRKPMFRIALLFVSEEVQVQRQISAAWPSRSIIGQVRASRNRHARRGTGYRTPTRHSAAIVTDLRGDDVRRACNHCGRFSISISNRCEGDLQEVQQNILKSSSYHKFAGIEPGGLRRDPQTFRWPASSHPRPQELVERLEMYEEQHKEVFTRREIHRKQI